MSYLIGSADEEITKAEIDFPSYLYTLYIDFMDGELAFDNFVNRPFAKDLIGLFEESDQSARRELLTDIIAMYSKDHFDRLVY